MEEEEVSEQEARELDEAKKRIQSTFDRILDRDASDEVVREEYPDQLREYLRAEAGRAKAERADNIRRARLKKWDEKVPQVWRGWSISDLPPGFQAHCYEWLGEGMDKGQNVVLSGGTGSGKTTMAYAISREVYAQGFKAKMWNVRELIAALNPTVAAASQTLQSTKDCPLLTLDDLGSEKKSEWTNERVLEILDHRWQWNKPTIVTTNLLLDGDGADSLQAWIGDRSYSRLVSGSLKLRLKGGDKRV